MSRRRSITLMSAAVAVAVLGASVSPAMGASLPAALYDSYHSPTSGGAASYFAGAIKYRGVELYTTDGTADGTKYLKDVYAGANSAFRGTGADLDPQFTSIGSKTVFVANGAKGVQLWSTDGTASGTIALTAVVDPDSKLGANPTGLTALGSNVYFAATSSKVGRELWVTTGTAKGTKVLADIQADADAPKDFPGSFPTGLAAAGSKVYMVVNAGADKAIWTTDGTTTKKGVTISSATGDIGEGGLTTFGSKVAYVLDNNSGQRDIWATDATTAGTVKVVSNAAIAYGSAPVAFDGALYYPGRIVPADGSDAYNGLSRSVAGSTAPGSVAKRELTGVTVGGNKLWFTTWDGTNNLLYTVSSATASAVLVKNLGAAAQLSELDSVYVNGQLYFWADGGLWTSDGTSAGTVLVKNFGFASDVARTVALGSAGDSVIVTAQDSKNVGSVWLSDGTASGTKQTLPRLAFTKTPVPTIKGTATVGATLTATVGTWAPTGADLTYQWKASGKVIAGATGKTFTATTAEAGKTLSFTVTGEKERYTTVAKKSAETKAVTQKFTTTVTPVITGVAGVGKTLTANPGVWTPTATSYLYQWYASGKAIAKATKSTYKIPSTLYGKTITVRVTGKRATTSSVLKMSAATIKVTKAFTKTVVPTVTGSSVVGGVLTATPKAWSPAALKTAFQWYRNGVAISGATAKTYTTQSADAGAKITVTTTGTRTFFTPTAVSSAAVGPLTLPSPK